MPEQIPYGVATSLINSLASAALREYGRINGVMDELERLKNTVESIRAVLLDADDKQDQSHAIQNWIRRLKDVLIPADDLLDEFLIQDMIHKRDGPHPNKVTKVLHSLSPNRIAFRHKMAKEIEKIQKMFDDVKRDMSGLNLNTNVGVVQKTNIEWRETSSHFIESDIIGREGDKEKIVSLLRQPHGDQDVSFVAIVGIGGLGKTALAQLVYNDGEVVRKIFEKFMWVCVSDNFDVKTIVKNMLKSLLPEKTIDDTLPLDSLQTMLHDNLSGKRYLLVLDDVWNESSEEWNKLRPSLICGAQGSNVLVTTRLKTVAQTMDVSDPYVLNGLTQEESWNLLKKIAFVGDTNGVNQSLESIGNKIAKKCSGVPLAIRSLGNILKNKREVEEWDHVLKGDFWKLWENEGNILPILNLSYHNLLPQQRQCFSYCSLFPKDWEFKKDELIQMWMAHGYLDCSVGGKCMEDLGNQFVNTFLMKSFFQEAKLNEDGDIIGFKMHDLMHHLATQVVGDDCCYLNSKTKRCPGKPLHVSVEFDAFCLLESLDASRLRTLIVFSPHDYLTYGKKLSIISTFKYLRVLKLFHLGFNYLCLSFEKSKHLRFLNIVFYLESVDKSIGNLVCLQTLNMDRLSRVISRKVVSKLINLRDLKISRWDFKDKTPVGFGKLSIQQQGAKWLSPLTNIIKIELSCYGLQYLPPLERLPFLKSLELRDLKDLEYIYYEEPILHESFFPSLKNLLFGNCDSLKGWRRMGDDLNDIKSSHDVLFLQFPCLSNLTIDRCQRLTHMPTFPSIKRFTVDHGGMLEATLNITASQYLIGFPPLSMLKSLKINKTILDMKHIPQYWLQNLTSLENLVFPYLSSEHFEAIEIWFKDDINYLPSLQKIIFDYCKKLKALPDWICKISSLRHIKIYNCNKLTLLPEGMTRLTNLHTLEIIKCRLLIEECEKETSATRPTIAHIPNIIIKYI